MAYKGADISISTLWDSVKLGCGSSVDKSHRDKSVHEIRKSIKCVRSFIFLVKEQVPQLDLETPESGFQNISRKLAPLRDSFVMKQTFAHYKGDFELLNHDAGVILDYSIGQKYLQLKSSFKSENSLGLAREDFTRLIASFDFGDSEIKIKDIQDRVAKSYRKCQKIFQKLSISSAPDKFHLFRKWSKKYQFQLELMNNSGILIKKDTPKKKLEKLNDCLGDENDLDGLKKYIKTYYKSFYKIAKPYFSKQKVKNRKKILALARANYK